MEGRDVSTGTRTLMNEPTQQLMHLASRNIVHTNGIWYLEFEISNVSSFRFLLLFFVDPFVKLLTKTFVIKVKYRKKIRN